MGGSPPHRRQGSGDNYYEDVDPRFVQAGTEGPVELQQNNTVPSALVPGYGRGANAIPEQNNQHLRVGNRGMGLDGTHSYEDLHGGPGSRSPGTESERSNFTSVSQRGINPRWPGNAPQMPPMQGQMGGMRGGPGGYGGGPRRGPPPQQRNEVLLESNPDFGLPGMGPRNRRPVSGPQQSGNQGRFAASMGQPQGLTGRSPYDQPGGAL